MRRRRRRTKGRSYGYTIRDQGNQHGKEWTVKEWLEWCEKEGP